MKFMKRKRGKEPNDAAVPSAANPNLSTDVLSRQKERELLEGFWDCKTELVRTLIRHFPQLRSHRPALEPWPMAQFIREHCGADARKVTAISRLYDRYQTFKHRLAMSNLRLATLLVGRFRRCSLSHEDLLQEAACGLMRAIDRFDLSHETRLATFAGWWIYQALQVAVAEQSYPVRLSPCHIKELGALQAELETLAHRGKRLPSAQELADRTGVSLDRLTHLHAVTRTHVSLDAVLHEDTDFQLAVAMADGESGSELISAEREEALQLLLQNLRPRERHVLDLRFGLAGKGEHTLTEIGDKMRISKERVRQIQEDALKKLRVSAEHGDWEPSLLPG